MDMNLGRRMMLILVVRNRDKNVKEMRAEEEGEIVVKGNASEQPRNAAIMNSEEWWKGNEE